MALRRGAKRAAEASAEVAARIDWLHEDLLTWKGPDPASYDLVCAQFLHLPRESREAPFDRLAAAVAPAGTLLIVAHHPSDMQITGLRPQLPELFYTASEVAGSLDPDQWHVLVADARPRKTIDSEGRTIRIHDAVLRARRRAGPG